MWKLENPMFRERVATQMCQYQSSHKKYPSDLGMRTTTQKPKAEKGHGKAETGKG